MAVKNKLLVSIIRALVSSNNSIKGVFTDIVEYGLGLEDPLTDQNLNMLLYHTYTNE